MSRLRPTSLIAAFAAMVLKVMICATCSRPYLRVTYSITSPRRFMQKSISISGIEIRSGLRKRSNRSAFCNRSISVISMAYETSDPAADPRPGPTGIFTSRAYLIKFPHDKEVARKLHLLNAVNLALQPLFIIRDRVTSLSSFAEHTDGRIQTLTKSLAAYFSEIAVDGVALRNGKLRKRDCSPCSA